MSDLVDGVVSLPDMVTYQDINAAYREAFGKDFPVRAAVGVGLPGDAGVEIMFTAVKSADSGLEGLRYPLLRRDSQSFGFRP